MNPFSDATVGGMLDAVTARHASREALVFGDERLTFADFQTRIQRVAAGLATL